MNNIRNKKTTEKTQTQEPLIHQLPRTRSFTRKNGVREAVKTIEKTAKHKNAHGDSPPTNTSAKAQKPTLPTHKPVHLTMAQIDLLRVEMTKLRQTIQETNARKKHMIIRTVPLPIVIWLSKLIPLLQKK